MKETINNSKEIQEVLKNIELLKQALKEKLINVNEYSALYLSYSKQLKSMEK